MAWSDQLAWAAAAIGISLAASLILFGIWWRGYSITDRSTGIRTISRDDGIMWMSLACTLWCLTSVVQTANLFVTGSLHLYHPALTFIFVLVSVTNSLFFVLATANIDVIKRDSGFLAKLLERVRENHNPYWILAALVIVAALLRFMNPGGKYLSSFDVLVSLVTIVLITWGFFKSFWKRDFRIIACLSITVFLIFTVAQVGDFFDLITPNLEPARRELLRLALSVGSDGMVSLLFIALTFSWMEELIKIDL